MDFLDRAFDEAFYSLVKTLRDKGSQQYMLFRATAESNFRGLITQRAGTNADLKAKLVQRMGAHLNMLDFAFRKIVPVFGKKKKWKDVMAELKKDGSDSAPEVAGKLDHLYEIYQLVVKGQPLPPASG